MAERCAWCEGVVHVELDDAVQLVDARWVHDECVPELADDAGLTDHERVAFDGWVAMMKRVRTQGIDGILTDDDRADLNKQLAEIAKRVHRG